ncbi:uncharacterized protein LOC143293418 [Babylonia areolata]|uniref:uncharacterized protein LOC143293418 n=1 Tax=Babylonia areolata TaxID=304850 RepID=UPI003FD5FD51
MAGHNYYLSWSVLLGLLLLWQPSVADAASCKQTGACFFDCGNTVLDLTPLKSAQFNDVIDSSGTSQFSYSPCKRFTEGVGCVKTYVCQVDSFNHSATIDVGSVMTASLNPSGDNYLQYSHKGNDGVKRTTTVTVKCDQSLTANTTLVVHGETKTGSDQYTMTLSSPHACFQRKGSTTPVRPLTTTTENSTTENTTPSSGNVTTPSGNATTENTTPSGNTTTENTTPSGNATT